MKKEKDLQQTKGTIAYVLTQHQDELYALINAGQIEQCRVRSIELLDDPSITDKNAVVNAKNVLKTSKINLFLSTLMTYMTGMKVSY